MGGESEGGLPSKHDIEQNCCTNSKTSKLSNLLNKQKENDIVILFFKGNYMIKCRIHGFLMD